MRFVNTPYDGVEFIEIPITSTTQRKFFFPVNEKLDGKIIRRIDLHAYSTCLAPSNRAVISYAALVKGFLTIRPKGNDVTIYKYPLFYLLNNTRSGGHETSVTENMDYPVQWELSFVEFAQTVSLSTAQSLVFIVYYQNPMRKMISKQGIKYLLNPLLNLFIGREQLQTLKITATVDIPNKLIFNFPHDEKYENIKVKAIRRTRDDFSQKTYLVLRDKTGKEIINHLPGHYMESSQTDRAEILLNNLVIDWPKSYVKVTNATSLIAGTEFSFYLLYTK